MGTPVPSLLLPREGLSMPRSPRGVKEGQEPHRICVSRDRTRDSLVAANLAAPWAGPWDNSIPACALEFSRGYCIAGLRGAASLPRSVIRRRFSVWPSLHPRFHVPIILKEIAAWPRPVRHSRESGTPFAPDLCHMAPCSSAGGNVGGSSTAHERYSVSPFWPFLTSGSRCVLSSRCPLIWRKGCMTDPTETFLGIPGFARAYERSRRKERRAA